MSPNQAQYTPLGTLVDVLGGGTPSKDKPQFWSGAIPWVSPKDMKRFVISDSIDHVSAEAVESSACKLIQPPAVLMVIRGMILAHTLPVAVTTVPVTINQDMKALRPKASMDATYLAYMISGASDQLLNQVEIAGHGTRRLATEHWMSLPIPVPPLPEQHRIVARIQELMSRADEIRRLRGEIAVEARAVLKSAVTERMAAFRGTCEQSALGALVGDRPGAMASGPFGSQLKHEEFVADGNLVIGIANVQRDRFDPVRKWMVNDQTLDRLKRYRVAPGDLLITVMGTVGRTCVVPHDIGVAVTSKHVYRVRLPADSVHPRFVSIAINFDHATVERLLGRAAGGVMPGLNSTKLRELLIPVPSRPAQEAFIEEIDRLKAIEHVLAHHEQAGDAHIQSSILRKAFAGEL